MAEQPNVATNPKFFSIILPRERNVTLAKLEAGYSMNVPAEGGGMMKVVVAAVGPVFQARSGTGWKAVRVVVVPTRAVSMLVVEEHENGRVSGFLRLKKGRV